MAYALVNFYKEDAWDVIPYSDIVFTDEYKENEDVLLYELCY